MWDNINEDEDTQNGTKLSYNEPNNRKQNRLDAKDSNNTAHKGKSKDISVQAVGAHGIVRRRASHIFSGQSADRWR
jgi:hypothetical protein